MSKDLPRRTAYAELLRTGTPEELRSTLRALYKSLPEVRAYFAARSGEASVAASLLAAKEAVSREFYPPRGFGRARSVVTRKVITSFCRTTSDVALHVDLLLHHASVGVAFIQDFGGANEALLSSLEASYRRALALLATPALRKVFRERCEAIVAASDGIGCGFHDELADLCTFAFRESTR